MYTLTLNLTISLGLSGVVTQKGPSWGSLSLSAMVPQSTPTATPSPTERKRSKLSSRTAEDALQWAVGEGIGEHLSLAGPGGEVEFGKVRCNICGSRVSFKTNVLRPFRKVSFFPLVIIERIKCISII